MSENTQNTVKATATRDFGDYDDDGNARRFVKDQSYDLPKGVFDNFVSVGLVTPGDATDTDAEKRKAPRA